MKKEILISFICFILSSSVGGVFGVREASAAVTEGEAWAVFNASITGGSAIRLHSPQIQGAPAKGGLRADVATRPFCFFDGRHYCVTDWHDLLVAYVDGPTEACPNLTVGDVKSELSTTEVTFTLDGKEIDKIDMVRTPIKAAVGPGKEWGFLVGSIFAPGELEVGPHTFSVEVTGSTFLPEDGCSELVPFTDNLPFSIPDVCENFPPYVTFYIDAAGKGACVE